MEKNMDKLFREMLDLVMSLEDANSFTKAFLSMIYKRNNIAKEIEIKKNAFEIVNGKFLASSKDKIAAEKIQSTLLAGSPEAVTISNEIMELEEVRKMFQNSLDAILLKKDLWVAERKAGI